MRTITLAAMVALGLAALAVPASAQTFSNPANITINDLAPATPYPSVIAVSGITDPVTQVTVTIFNFSHTFPGDVGIKVSDPFGTPVVLDGRVGGGTDAVNVTITFSMTAGGPLPSPVVSGTFLPTNPGNPVFAAPAPAGQGVNLGVYNSVNPNGNWNLWVQDFAAVDIGNIAGGWSLTFTTSGVPEPTTLALCGLGLAGAAGAGWKRHKARRAANRAARLFAKK